LEERKIGRRLFFNLLRAEHKNGKITDIVDILEKAVIKFTKSIKRTETKTKNHHKLNTQKEVLQWTLKATASSVAKSKRLKMAPLERRQRVNPWQKAPARSVVQK